MKNFRENIIYVLLGVVALVLVGITVGLQLYSSSSEGLGLLDALFSPTAAPLAASTPNLPATAEPLSVVASTTVPTVAAEPATPIAVEVVAAVAAAPAAPGAAGTSAQSSTTASQPGVNTAGVGDVEAQMLAATRLTTSLSDEVITELVYDDQNALGFVSFDNYTAQRDKLRSLALPALTGSGFVNLSAQGELPVDYPLVRPLFLYTTASALQQPETAAYLACYLGSVDVASRAVGIFPPSTLQFAQNINRFNEVLGRTGVPTCEANGLTAATVVVEGSTTVAPLSEQIRDRFMEAGYAGNVIVNPVGSGEGISRFCTESDAGGRVDIAMASRPIREDERAACRDSGREPLEFVVATDALAVVVSTSNSFAQALTFSQLQDAFTSAELWSDVNPSWPQESIARVVPPPNRGTFDFFVEAAFDPNLPDVAAALAAQVSLPPTPNPSPEPAAAEPVAASSTAASSTTTDTIATDTIATDSTLLATNTIALTDGASPATSTPVPPTPPSVDASAAELVFGSLDSDSGCSFATEIVARVLADNFDYAVRVERFSSIERLYRSLAQEEGAEPIDLTLCHAFPRDSQYLARYGGRLNVMGSVYARADNQRWYALVHSSLYTPLQREAPCVYSLFDDRLALGDLQFETQDVSTWLAEHEDTVAAWVSCEE